MDDSMNLLRSHVVLTPPPAAARVTSSAMELLPLVSVVCVCALSWSGTRCGAAGAVSRVSAAEGSDVVLPCRLSGSSVESLLFDWKKDGGQEVFLYDGGPQYARGRSGQDRQFRGRVRHFPAELQRGNASILLADATVADSGNYSCHFPRLRPHAQMFHVQLLVGASPRPVIMVLNQTRDWALLQCEVQAASPEPAVVWQDAAGHVVPSRDPEVTERDGRFSVVLRVTVSRTDRYRCVSTQRDINHQIHTETYLHLDGASPEPSIVVLDQTRDWALLQCSVRGASPEPAVVWQDAAGHVVPSRDPEVTERDGRFSVLLQTTVTKTGRYRCVSTQRDINHQTQIQTFVRLDVPESPTGWIVAAVLGAVLVVVVILLAVLVYTGLISCNKGAARSRSVSSQQLPDQLSK